MDFELSDDQRAFQDSVSRYLRDQYDFLNRQSVVASDEPFSEPVWQACAELGWLCLPFDEAHGGLGGTSIDSIVLFEELGRHLVIEPFLETLVLFGGVLRRAEFANASQYIEQLMSGCLQGALAHFEIPCRTESSLILSKAEPASDGFCINGVKTVVYNAPAADIIVVSAKLGVGEDIGLFVVPTAAKGISMTAYPTVDGRVAADVTLDNVRVNQLQCVARGTLAQKILREVFDEAQLALSAEMVGAMESLISATVEYAKEREQFGSPLSKKQVLQHMMSDMFIDKELARSLLYAAAIKRRDAREDASAFIAAAKAKADKSARRVAHSAIQIHGAIGTSEELNIGHYLKRITVASQSFGSTRQQLRRYASLLEDSGWHDSTH